MNEQIIKELADSMNVSVTDLMCLAKSVAISIKQDKAEQAMIEMPIETTRAYVAHAVRKMNQFTSTYLTNGEARNLFNQNVLQIL
ncbi:MAG: hypothetical protein WAW61_22270 [Methylococcaceae bacterium]